MSLTTVKQTSTVFRYKFVDEFTSVIENFASIHKYDDTSAFYEAWNEWIKENKDVIEREQTRLDRLGYKGDINAKMYKSARYYFKNKSTEKKETVKRRAYINLDKQLLQNMEKHINKVAFIEGYKPAHAYNNFISDALYSSGVNNELERLKVIYADTDLTEANIENKIKKTYKNRYFIQQKKNSSK